MATTLSFSPPSPFNVSFIDKSYQCSPTLLRHSSSGSLGTVRRLGQRHLSNGSFVTASSHQSGFLSPHKENDTSQRKTSSKSEHLRSLETSGFARKCSSHISRKSSWGTDIPPPLRSSGTRALDVEAALLDEIDLGAGCGEAQSEERTDIYQELTDGLTLGLSLDVTREESVSSRDTYHEAQEAKHGQASTTTRVSEGPQPFKKWIRTLRRKNRRKRGRSYSETEARAFEGGEISDLGLYSEPTPDRLSHHKKSSSASSMGFVTAVKAASLSLATFSLAARSRRLGRSSQGQSEFRKSRLSNQDGRLSMDSDWSPAAVNLDPGVWTRSLKRRSVIEELLNSEESYVADLKLLLNKDSDGRQVYLALLASTPAVSYHTRSSIRRNVTEILQLHEELLGELHRVIPYSEYTQVNTALPVPPESRGHVRWHSFDAVPKRVGDLKQESKARYSLDLSDPVVRNMTAMTAEPKVAADVAAVFDKMMRRFFTYEEYGSKYEMMVKDVASSHKSMPPWHAYEKGIEALANCVISINGRDANSKKGLTFADLLIKPIQRVCKYPLLFADLYKHTPVCDCPESHAELEKVLHRLRETAREINKATDDPAARVKIERTWLLQDRLIVQDQPTQNLTLRSLGHVLLCGVLHVAFQTSTGVRGEYMLCVLYKSCLLLATTVPLGYTFTVEALISIADLHIEQADNGKGLQCHTALYTWKIVFESDHRLYEMILSACSAKEEEEWKTGLLERSAVEGQETFDDRANWQDVFSSMSLNVKPIAKVFGQPGTLARRISVHRATTVGPRSNLCQVIIRDTHTMRDNGEWQPAMSSPIARSQSLLSTNRIPVLAPKRADRVRLENALADVWTRERLPFPGMGARRGDQLITSASTLMRKLSMVSITSTFSKRSTSYASLQSNRRANESRRPDHQRKPYTGLSNPDIRGTESDRRGGKADQIMVGAYPMMLPPPRVSSAKGLKHNRESRPVGNLRTLSTPLPSIPKVDKNEHTLEDRRRASSKRFASPTRLGFSFSAESFKKLFH
ncbi:MAG: hypothetical protein M1836_005395 [Candelina mexicana]|nr:MAG: hypothetical protein M1836_005395 [Candelina mexicana]